jgi:hypothetical protein
LIVTRSHTYILNFNSILFQEPLQFILKILSRIHYCKSYQLLWIINAHGTI